MKKTVLFILSSNFSGSHYLSLLIGSHSCANHLGEVKNLVKKKQKNEYTTSSIESTRHCYLCGKNKDCILFQGINDNDIPAIYEKIFRRLPPTVVIVVDTSKKVKWAKKFIKQSEYDIKFIHLIRDPRALIRKWSLHYKTPKDRIKQRIKQIKRYPLNIFKIMVSAQWYIYLLKWVWQNREIKNFLRLCGKPYRLITYHDLATNSENVLSSVMEWLGLNYEREQIEYWKHNHHGTQKPKYDWIKEKSSQYFDIRWKDDLSKNKQISIINHREVTKLIRELSLTITPNGLVNLENGKRA
jgi:hypothetical protein